MEDILKRLADSSPNESPHELQCRCFDAAEEISRLRAAMKEAANGFDQAAEDISDWGNYASSYFQEKHKLNDDVKQYKELAFMLRILLTPNVKLRGCALLRSPSRTQG